MPQVCRARCLKRKGLYLMSAVGATLRFTNGLRGLPGSSKSLPVRLSPGVVRVLRPPESRQKSQGDWRTRLEYLPRTRASHTGKIYYEQPFSSAAWD